MGDKITVKIKAHDAKSGIMNAYVFLYNPENEENKYITLDYNQNTDEWIGTYVVQFNDRPGTWTLSDIYLEDSVGNYAYTSSEANVKVENPNGDFTAPVISKIEVSPATIQVGEKVTITSDVTDDKSGVREVIANLSHPSGASKYITMRYNATTKKWTGSFEALETTAPGEWSINISASDQFGNYSDMTSDQPFTVVNPDGDYTGPVIQGVDINPNEVNAGDQVTITAAIDDDKSGVGWVQAYVSYLGELTFKKDSTSGKWVATAKVPTNVPDNEEIMIYDLLAYDLKGNLTQQWVGQSFIVHNETGDYTAPVADSIEITPAEVTAGEKVHIKAKITDEQSGVKQVIGYFGNEYENRAVDFSYDEASGLWVADYTTSVNERPGTWDLNLEVWDNNENSDFIRSDKYVTINNPNADVTAPVIDAVEITPSTANVGDVVTITADVKDNESGVRYVKAYLNPVAGNNYNQLSVPLTFNEELNKWVGTYKISETVQDGLWNVDVMAVDHYANSDYYSGATFNVTNPDGDFEAPYLNSLKVSSSTANVGDTVTFEAKIADSKSGVKSASIRLGLEESNNDITLPLTYDKEKDVWSASYQIPAYARAGVQFISVMVEDNAGNQNDINPYQSLVILNDNPDKEAPVVGEVSLTPDQAAEGDTVEFKVKLEDSYSGVKNAAIELSYPDSAAAGEGNPDLRHIDLTYDANQKAWVGTYTIKPTDNLGDWFVDVMAEDMAGNSTYVLSPKKLVIVKAAEGPAAPVVNEVTDKDTSVTGQAAAGLTVEVVANGSKLGSVEAGTDGKFTVAIPGQAAGTELTVTATNKAGKVSKATTVVVKDATAPAKPVVKEVSEKDTSVTGTAEAGSVVEVKANGTKLGSAEAGSDGKFTVAIPVQAAGTELTVIATDKSGNVSEATKVVVKDTTAPAKPVVNEVTDKDTTVTGTAEAGSAVEVKSNGTKLGSAEAGTDGKFSVTIPVQKAGTELTITVTDKDGNVSEATKVVVKDVTPPALPVVNEVAEKDTAVTGKAEPGAVIVVTLSGSTQLLGSGSAGADGKFAITIPVQKANTQLVISISDQAGNFGGSVTVTVSSAKLSGWVKDNKSWYYYDPATHVKKIGWFKDGVVWYYFNKDGVMQTGWQKISTVWYYFNSGGAMQTGWLKLGTTWYYFNSGGAMVTGWLKSGATWYYFNTSGAMQIGWLKSGASWYYFNGSGAMATGWVKISGKWYYFNSNGTLK